MRRAMAVVVLAGATLAAYHRFLPGTFVLDDFGAVVDNPSIRQLWPPAWLAAPPDAGVAGRPFANFTFALNHAISGTGPWSYHAGNIALHFGCALVLFGVVRRTLLRPPLHLHHGAAAGPLALLVAALWTVHPLTSGAVGYVSQRTEVLMALCLLFTLYAFARHAESGSRGWAVAATAACALGMAAKEVMAAAPLLVLLYDRTFFAGSLRAAWREHRRVHLALASTWLLLAWLIVSSQLGERGVGFNLGVGAGEYLLTQCRALFLYLRLAGWPHPLVFDYGWDFARDMGAAGPALLACAALGGATVVAWWRRPALGFAGAWFFLILAPTSSFIPIVQQPIAESRMYLPLAGFLVVVVLAAHRVSRQRTRLVLAAGAAVALGFSSFTARRGDLFRSEIALWTDTVVKRPVNARAHGNLAAALLRANRLPESMSASEAALRLLPRYPDAHVNLGVALARDGRVREAIPHYEAALRDDPAHAEAHYNLGAALVQSERPAEAVAHFVATLRRKSGHAAAHNNLAVALLQLDRAAASAGHARAALSLEPAFAEAHYNLGNALARVGDHAGAVAAYEAALRADPRFAKAHNNLGVLQLRAGRLDEAGAHFEAALRLNPDYPEARRNLEALRPR